MNILNSFEGGDTSNINRSKKTVKSKAIPYLQRSIEMINQNHNSSIEPIIPKQENASKQTNYHNIAKKTLLNSFGLKVDCEITPNSVDSSNSSDGNDINQKSYNGDKANR